MNDKRQSSDNDDDNFLDPRQSHFRLLSNNQHIFILHTLYYTSYLSLLQITFSSIHFYCKYFLYSRSFHICWCLISWVQDDTRYDTLIQERQRAAAISSWLMRHIYLSLYLSPPARPWLYPMSGLGFLLICRGRSRANICFIFHSFIWSSSLQLRHTSSFTLGNWRWRNRRKSHVIIYHFYGRVSSGGYFLKIIPSTWSLPVMGSWAGLPGTVIIIASTETEIVNKMLAQYLYYIYYDPGL